MLFPSSGIGAGCSLTLISMNKTDKHHRRILQEIIDAEPASIRAYVAEEALDREQVKDFFDDLFRCGCISGVIGGLIYYRDTHAFFDRYYDEIEELREEYEDALGEPIRIKGDLKNHLAWFAFEETAYQMAMNDLELEGL